MTRVAILLLLSLTGVSSISVPTTAAGPCMEISAHLVAQGQACGPCQHKEDGKCVDNDDCYRPPDGQHGHVHVQHSGEQCWVITECLCRNGQVPGSHDCGSCSYQGESTICRRH
jgi:hypothetical protein